MTNKMENEVSEKEVKALLKQALAPLENPKLLRDLWPQMLRRLDFQPLRVPWFDWVLVGAVTAALLFFPGTIPALLYQL